MYGFRKPISATTFEGLVVFGISYKVIVIITQVFGYLTSKLLGIKIISELKKENRVKYLINIFSIALLSLFLFAITPFPFNFIWFFINGFALGFVWGIVISYIEGRKNTDVIAVFLTVSFVFSSGMIKSLGRYLIENVGITEFYMPFVVASIFLIPLVITIWMLEKIPAPTQEDIQLRTERKPITKEERLKIFKAYYPGLCASLFVIVLLTILRDIKDNFFVEIIQYLNPTFPNNIYIQIESIISLLVILFLSFIVFIKNSKTAFNILHIVIILGLLLVLLSLLLYQQKWISDFMFLIIHGLGLYLSYIVFQSIYFERFIAAFKIKSNVGFFIYVADFLGYLSSCTLLILKELSPIKLDWGKYFIYLSWVVIIFGLFGTLIAYIYFIYKQKFTENEV